MTSIVLSFQNRKRLNLFLCMNLVRKVSNFSAVMHDPKNRKQSGCFAGVAVLPIGS
jgi:hypothetical protein